MVAYGLKDVLDILPEVRYAFAYGSAVTRQPGLYSKKDTKPLVDFMLAVDSPEQWHQQVKQLVSLQLSRASASVLPDQGRCRFPGPIKGSAGCESG